MRRIDLIFTTIRRLTGCIAIKDGTITRSQNHIKFAEIVNLTASVLLTIPILTDMTLNYFTVGFG